MSEDQPTNSQTTISPILAERCARLLVEGEGEVAQLMADEPQDVRDAIRAIIEMAKDYLNSECPVCQGRQRVTLAMPGGYSIQAECERCASAILATHGGESK